MMLWRARLPAMEHNLQNLSLLILRGDHHHKFPNKATRGLFPAIYTIMNEYEQVVAAPFTLSTKTAELQPVFQMLLLQQQALGLPTAAYYSDNPHQIMRGIPLQFVSDPFPQPPAPANMPPLQLPPPDQATVWLSKRVSSWLLTV
jgi:hypothetical protein